MEESSSAHLESVLEGGISLWFLASHSLEAFDVLCWISRHITDADGDTIAHTNYSQLGDGVLLEVFGDEFRCEADGKEVSCRPEIFLYHGEGEVED